MPKRHIVTAAGAEARLEAARRWIEDALGEAGEILVLAPSRGAADDLLRRSCPAGAGLFGVHRATPLQLAAELATPALAQGGLAPVSGLGSEALAARAISICAAAGELAYFEPVADAPGMARALAATLKDLRGHGVASAELAATGAPGRDLGRLLARYELELEGGSLVDDAALLALATGEIPQSRHALLALPLLLLDAAPDSLVERRFLAAVLGRAPAAFATVLAGDAEGRAALRDLFDVAERDLDGVPGAATSKLERLRAQVFAAAPAEPPAEEEGAPPGDDSFTFLSAAGEGRECVEIARRIHALARNAPDDTPARGASEREGVGFDEIAILLRDPDAYLPLVEEALRRAGVPAFFTRGTIRPHPAGRALLALLDCRAEDLSAARFAEYLSLGQVPELSDAGAPPVVEVPWVAPEGDQLVFKTLMPAEAEEEVEAEAPGKEPDLAAPAFEGSLRTPRGWERLLVEARVIGNLSRWQERLDGLAKELRLRLRDSGGEEPARERHLKAQLEHLGHLERFALPVIDALSELPDLAPWGEWLDALENLASSVLRHADKVLAVLAELRPMDRVGPVTLDEVRRVLGERLAFLRLEPPARRYGRVFVATVDEARGRSFEAVFLPGLAEGIFPRRALEDPLLLDDYRRRLDAALPTQAERVARERRLLRIAAGAARSRLIVSYPNIDVLQGRPRVPSFYALDLLRAAEGRIPDLRRLETQAAAGSQSLLGWAAPRESSLAIDDAEYDLSVLEPLLRHGATAAQGQARFVLRNPRLDRALRSRYLRWKQGSSFTFADGVVDPDEATLAGLERYRLEKRSYSPTSLQRYAGCPYRFLLYAVWGLRPRDEAARLEQLDPLTRGSLFHEVQLELFCALEKKGLLSFDESEEHAVATVLAQTVARVAERYHEELAPAIERVWRIEIEELHTDLRGWVRSRIAARERWRPARFELAFGLARSRAPFTVRGSGKPLEVADVAGGKRLRGIVDLVEDDPEGPALRVTDHKTGKALASGRLVIDGGKTLQPVLYGLAIERLLEQPVEAGRLFYCTRRGRYEHIEVKLDDDSRGAARVVLEEIDRAVTRGFLPAAPDEGECRWCDYRLICGPNEEARIRRKHPQRLVPLTRLRSMP